MSQFIIFFFNLLSDDVSQVLPDLSFHISDVPPINVVFAPFPVILAPITISKSLLFAPA